MMFSCLKSIASALKVAKEVRNRNWDIRWGGKFDSKLLRGEKPADNRERRWFWNTQFRIHIYLHIYYKHKNASAVLASIPFQSALVTILIIIVITREEETQLRRVMQYIVKPWHGCHGKYNFHRLKSQQCVSICQFGFALHNTVQSSLNRSLRQTMSFLAVNFFFFFFRKGPGVFRNGRLTMAIYVQCGG